MHLRQGAALLATLACLPLLLPNAAEAKQPQRRAAAAPRAQMSGVVYPQCLFQGKTAAHWIPQQMPFNIWVSHGLSLDDIADPSTKEPAINTSNMQQWGDAVIGVLQSGRIRALPVAEGFSDEQYRAALEGINEWKALEKEGLFSFNLCDNPDDADVYVFFTHHFVNKLGMGLFENDIRGYTSKWLLPASQVINAIQTNNLDLVRRSRKPVVVLLRTTLNTTSQAPMPYSYMKASAAHEMGHVLGIDGHSTNPGDLMSTYYGRGVISPNDAATMRYLYQRPAQMIP